MQLWLTSHHHNSTITAQKDEWQNKNKMRNRKKKCAKHWHCPNMLTESTRFHSTTERKKSKMVWVASSEKSNTHTYCRIVTVFKHFLFFHSMNPLCAILLCPSLGSRVDRPKQKTSEKDRTKNVGLTVSQPETEYIQLHSRSRLTRLENHTHNSSYAVHYDIVNCVCVARWIVSCRVWFAQVCTMYQPKVFVCTFHTEYSIQPYREWASATRTNTTQTIPFFSIFSPRGYDVVQHGCCAM